MMYFERDGKYNFVDENNVVLGYVSRQDCCETAGWFLADAVPDNPGPDVYDADDGGHKSFDFLPYRFDPEFFAEVPIRGLAASARDGYVPTLAVFRIVAPGLPERYIVLYNIHEGYYSHGFEVSHSGRVIRTGIL